MKRQLSCLSPVGVLAGLLVVIAIVGYTRLRGGNLFSPGPVTAASSRNAPLDGHRSHADFEGLCIRCHRPWHGADPLRCLTCHANVRDQIDERAGLHGQLQNPSACTICHTEHKGREASITLMALSDFPHQQTGFSRARHLRRADGQPFACADCHSSSDYAFNQVICENCHTGLDAGPMTQHVADFGRGCLSCHDGSGGLTGFDHNIVFALDGVHAKLDCTACHANQQVKDISSDCVACHGVPDVHGDQFGVGCASCHTTQAWLPARLLKHTFPLDHGSPIEVECQVCHPTNYLTYTCYGCHEHEPAQVEKKHQEEGIPNSQDCTGCHPAGREDAVEHGDQDSDNLQAPSAWHLIREFCLAA